jgi:CheY-like chemotaxis protein
MDAGTVLLVEDEPALRGLIRRMLVSAGYEVVEAKNGAEALGHYRRLSPDLVITDVRMPHVDGLSLLDRLWAQGETPRGVVMSACRLPRALPPGVVFLSKPFTRGELLDYVHLLTRSVSAVPAPAHA